MRDDSSDSSDDFCTSKICDDWKAKFDCGDFGEYANFPDNLKIERPKPSELSAGDLAKILQTIRKKSEQNGVVNSNGLNGTSKETQNAINRLLGVDSAQSSNLYAQTTQNVHANVVSQLTFKMHLKLI